MRGDGLDHRVAHGDVHPMVGNGDHAAFGLFFHVAGHQVRHETFPEFGDDDLGFAIHQPFVQGGNDVWILVRGEDIVDVFYLHIFGVRFISIFDR